MELVKADFFLKHFLIYVVSVKKINAYGFK